MPWKETNVVNLRLKFVVKSFDRNVNFTQLCNEFGISTKTGYKWKERFLEGGVPALEDQSRKPLSNSHVIPTETILAIVRLKQMKKNWGPKKIHAILVDRYPDSYIPSVSTVERILKKAGLVKKRRVRNINNTERIQNRTKATQPNHIWTVDFKGWWYTTENEKCEPLTVRDDFSKFILSIKILEKGDISCVKAEFEKLFEKYGLPEIIRSDNGPPFASPKAHFGLTKLAAWWLSLGIRLDRIDPGSPYQNGAHERMHLDIMNDLEHKIDGDLKLHQSFFDVWKKEFNAERPHEALGMKTPAKFYTKSRKKYKPSDEIKYPEGILSRQVNTRGYINYRGRRVFVSNAFNGFNIGIDECSKHESKVLFANNIVGNIDKNNFVFTPNDELITMN